MSDLRDLLDRAITSVHETEAESVTDVQVALAAVLTPTIAGAAKLDALAARAIWSMEATA